MSHSLRIAIVTRSLMMGGTQHHIVKLCQELSNANLSISVCLLINDEPRDLINDLPSNVNLHICPFHRHDLRTVFWLARVVRAEKAQVVHSFSWHADFYSAFLKILIRGVRVIASERGDRGTRDFYTPAYQFVDKFLVFKLVDAVCANSHFGRQLLITQGCDPAKITVIPNGVNLSSLDGQPTAEIRNILQWPSNSVIGCIVSRLIDYKGIDRFIESVQNCDPSIRFIIVGDGPEKSNLIQLIDKLSLKDRVVLLGTRHPAIPFIKAADFCILPTTSGTEHCSNSILEYMACGKPVVAMDAAGNAELIVRETTGFLLDPHRVDEMSIVLQRLALDRDLREQMGLAGRQRIENFFQMKVIADRFCSLWKAAVSSRGDLGFQE